MSRQGNNRSNDDDEALRSINDISIHSRSESLRNASTITIRDPSHALSAQGASAAGNDVRNHGETQRREAIPTREGLANISTARYYPEPPRGSSQTQNTNGRSTCACCERTNAPVGGNFHLEKDVATAGSCTSSDPSTIGTQAIARSQGLPMSGAGRNDLPTANSSSDNVSGGYFQTEQMSGAVGGVGITQGHAGSANSSLQTQPKRVAFDETVSPSSGTQRATAGEPASSRATGQNAAASGMDTPSVIGSCLRFIYLLLIGKTGNGKSATGNSILRRRAFKSSGNTNSVTRFIEHEVCDFRGRIIKVVDAPGVGDTRSDHASSTRMIQVAMQYAMVCNPQGYDAFLLVFRYGGKFTDEEKNAIAFLKRLFGSDFVRKCCILVVTYGDSFENDPDELNQTFEQWLSSQTGDFKDLVEECEGRVVLFDNITRDHTKKEQQLCNLLELVDRIEHRYTDVNFEEAARRREELENGVKISEEWCEKLSLLLQKFDETLKLQNPAEQAQPLNELREETEVLEEELGKFDSRTYDFQNFLSLIRSVKSSLQEEIRLLPQRLDDEEEPEDVRRRRQTVPADLYSQYQSIVRNENVQRFLSTVVGAISWPFMRIREWLMPRQSS